MDRLSDGGRFRGGLNTQGPWGVGPWVAEPGNSSRRTLALGEGPLFRGFVVFLAEEVESNRCANSPINALPQPLGSLFSLKIQDFQQRITPSILFQRPGTIRKTLPMGWFLQSKL